MKYTACFLLLLVFFSCRKELGSCKNHTELTDRINGIDPSLVTYQPFRDTLAKYPQLVPVNFWSYQNTQSMSCEMYYKGLPVLSGAYALYSSNNTLVNQGAPVIPTTAVIVTEPGISIDKAVEEARHHINLDYICVNYRLGLFNEGQGLVPNYRLAWKIIDSKRPYHFVVLDAADKRVYQVSGGNWVY